MEGSVRKAANRVRITGQLVDAASGAHIWADRFDGELGDIFDLQDQVTESVVGAIAPAVDSTRLSVRNCVTRRPRLAPSAALTATSRLLAWPLDSSRFARFVSVPARSLW